MRAFHRLRRQKGRAITSAFPQYSLYNQALSISSAFSIKRHDISRSPAALMSQGCRAIASKSINDEFIIKLTNCGGEPWDSVEILDFPHPKPVRHLYGELSYKEGGALTAHYGSESSPSLILEVRGWGMGVFFNGVLGSLMKFCAKSWAIHRIAPTLRPLLAYFRIILGVGGQCIRDPWCLSVEII